MKAADHEDDGVPIKDKLLWSVAEVADMTGLGERTIWRKVAEGIFPSPIVVKGCRRKLWRSADVEKWTLKLPSTP